MPKINPPNTSQEEAQKKLDIAIKKAKEDKFVMNPTVVGDHRVSATGQRSYSKNWDKEKAGGLSYEEWIKKPGNKAKEDKFVASTNKNLSETWQDPTKPTPGGGKTTPPPIDPSGFTPEGISTDAINTKLGDIDGKLQGRGSRLTKRKEESTDLGAEGFGSKGTPLKTRGISGQNWSLS